MPNNPRGSSNPRPRHARRHPHGTDWVDRSELGCAAWAEARTLRGCLARVEMITCDHERRWRFAIEVVSPKGLRRRVLLDDDELAQHCLRLLDQKIAVRAYREDGVWELDGGEAARFTHGRAIRRDSAAGRAGASRARRRVLH